MDWISEQLSSKRSIAATGLVAAILSCSFYAAAQDDLTAPPRINESSETPTTAADADIAESSAATALEEIVVVSDQNPWRLPDLGSSWRAEQAAETDSGRITTELLPLWDPDAEELPTRNPFSVTDDVRRVGFIEVFRVRFGGR